MKALFLWIFLLLLPLCSAASTTIAAIELRGAIGPAGSRFVQETMERARAQNAEMVLIELDTPGGLSSAMRDMIQTITNSPVPVIVYVSPKGAHAASAGTYLLYAAHIAAMAPGTNLGAATPVSLMSAPKMEEADQSKASTLERKARNDAVAYIKSLAELNDRNATWAVMAVEEARSLSAREALRLNVIDLMADDRTELLEKLDGRSVTVKGRTLTLQTKDPQVILLSPDWKTRLLSAITDPNIAYMLLLLALYGIFFELMNPGSLFPGVIGAISGILALYALNMLPFNYAGLLLMLLGIALMIAEVFVAGFGILGIGGTVAFAVGSLLLFDSQTLGQGISTPLIIAFSLLSFLFFVYVLRTLLRSRSVRAVSGIEEMIGSTATVIERREKRYRVRCHGEIWYAESEQTLSIGQTVRVKGLNGLILHVETLPADSNEE